MAKHYTVYRKRPDLVEVPVRLTNDPGNEEADFDLVLKFKRPNIPQHINLAAAYTTLRTSVDPLTKRLDATVYATQTVGLVELVHSVEGLADEDGEGLSWGDLTPTQQEDLLLDLPPEVILEVFSSLILSGRLEPAKKKPSEPT